jgi:hypothetical protein
VVVKGTPGDPLECPVGLLLDAGDGVYSPEEVVLLNGVLDVCLQKEAVHLCNEVGRQLLSAQHMGLQWRSRLVQMKEGK